jgi:hypothetical protein
MSEDISEENVLWMFTASKQGRPPHSPFWASVISTFLHATDAEFNMYALHFPKIAEMCRKYQKQTQHYYPRETVENKFASYKDEFDELLALKHELNARILIEYHHKGISVQFVIDAQNSFVAHGNTLTECCNELMNDLFEEGLA